MVEYMLCEPVAPRVLRAPTRWATSARVPIPTCAQPNVDAAAQPRRVCTRVSAFREPAWRPPRIAHEVKACDVNRCGHVAVSEVRRLHRLDVCTRMCCGNPSQWLTGSGHEVPHAVRVHLTARAGARRVHDDWLYGAVVLRRRGPFASRDRRFDPELRDRRVGIRRRFERCSRRRSGRELMRRRGRRLRRAM